MHSVEGVRRLGRLATGFDLLDPTVLAISSSAAVATRIYSNHYSQPQPENLFLAVFCESPI